MKMKIKLKLIFLPIFFIVIVGCSAIPLNMHSSGQISQDYTYSNRIGYAAGSGQFSFKIPQATDYLTFLSIRMTDDFPSPALTTVVIGPTPHDYTKYSAYVVLVPPHSNQNVERAKDNLMDIFVGAIINNNDAQLTLNKIYQKDFLYKGMSARYVVYTYSLPDTAVISVKGITNKTAVIVTVAGLMIVYPYDVSAILTMKAYDFGQQNTQEKNQINNSNRDQVINMTWPALANFYNSFSISS